VSELTADLFVSLDGFARADDAGPYFDHGGPELDEWIRAELDKPQGVVFGRVTYELFAPMSSNGADAASQRLTSLPKIVVSSTLSEPLQARAPPARAAGGGLRRRHGLGDQAAHPR